MKTILALGVFLMLVFPSRSLAEGWTFGVDGGLAVPTQNFFPTNPGDAGTHSLPYFQSLNSSDGWIVSVDAYHSVWKGIDAGLVLSYVNMGAWADSPVFPSQGGPCCGVRTNLGTVESWDVLPSVRIHPWTFGHWTPFLEADLGWSWNQWSVQEGNFINASCCGFGARLSNALMVRGELGTDYRISHNVSLESLVGLSQSDPLGSVDLPQGTGGMDEEFNLTFFFVSVGVRFNL